MIVRLAPPSLPRLGETTDSRVLLFALGATLAIGFIFGITPAIFLRRSKPYEVLNRVAARRRLPRPACRCAGCWWPRNWRWPSCCSPAPG